MGVENKEEWASRLCHATNIEWRFLFQNASTFSFQTFKKGFKMLAYRVLSWKGIWATPPPTEEWKYGGRDRTPRKSGISAQKGLKSDIFEPFNFWRLLTLSAILFFKVWGGQSCVQRQIISNKITNASLTASSYKKLSWYYRQTYLQCRLHLYCSQTHTELWFTKSF